MTVNPNLSFLREKIPLYKIIALQGGTRSAKTWSTLQFLIELCMEFSGMSISICRETLPALKATVMKDFFAILEQEGLYKEENHNKTDRIYSLNGNLIDYFSLDEPQKIRGRKRDILFINEANEVDVESWKQLLFRTSGKVIIDYNPSMYEHWIYDQVLTREDCALLVTNHKDNEHLSEEQHNEIERYKDFDYEYYRVFGLGERGKLKTGMEFFHAFNRAKHVKPCAFDTEFPVHLSYDFNVVPYMTELCCQIVNTDKKMTFRFFREYCLSNPDNSGKAVAKAFLGDYAEYNPLIFYYGDAQGKKRIEGQGNKIRFDDIEAELIKYLHADSDRVLRKSPNHFKARDFMNLLFAGFWPDIEIEIDPSCKELIKDLENVKVSIEGMHKERFNDKVLGVSYEKYGHTSQAMYYLIISVLNDLYRATSERG